ncbi:MAG: CARDB domain-containing protein [Stygiobacter sp.]
MKIVKLFFVFNVILFLTFTYSLAQENNGYDIKAVSVTFMPYKITLMKAVVFNYIIGNNGLIEIPSKSYDVEFYIDNKLVDFDYNTPKVKLKGIIKYSTQGKSKYIPKKLGKHTFKLIVDPKNRLKETNKKNNVIEGYFVVKK